MRFFLAYVFLFTGLICGYNIAHAELVHSELYGFSIEIPADWSKTKPKKSWTLFTYAKLGSGENLNINVLDVDGRYSIKQISLEETFGPYFDYAQIIETSYENHAGILFRHCVYKLKDSDIKMKIEGKYRLQYYAVQWVKLEKLYTLTFTDSENNFGDNFQTFSSIANSIIFGK